MRKPIGARKSASSSTAKPSSTGSRSYQVRKMKMIRYENAVAITVPSAALVMPGPRNLPTI